MTPYVHRLQTYSEIVNSVRSTELVLRALDVCPLSRLFVILLTVYQQGCERWIFHMRY